MWYCDFCPTGYCKRQVWSSVRWHRLWSIATFLFWTTIIPCSVTTSAARHRYRYLCLFLQDLLCYFVGCVPYAWLKLLTHSVAWLCLFFFQLWHGSSWATVAPVNTPTSTLCSHSSSRVAHHCHKVWAKPNRQAGWAAAVCLPLVEYTAASTAQEVGVFTGETTAHNPLYQLHSQLLEEKIRFTCIQPKPD